MLITEQFPEKQSINLKYNTDSERINNAIKKVAIHLTFAKVYLLTLAILFVLRMK